MTQDRRGTSEIRRGMLSLLRNHLAGRPEDLPFWGYVSLGKLFTSLGLSLVIRKMKPSILVHQAPEWW